MSNLICILIGAVIGAGVAVFGLALARVSAGEPPKKTEEEGDWQK